MELIPLSPREKTTLHYVAWGYTNRELAMLLGVSVKTVEAHKANGMRKLRVGTRSALVRFAVAQGWLVPASAPPVADGRAPSLGAEAR